MEKRVEDLENQLNKILSGCEICKAKVCGICPNGKMKKNIKMELKKIQPEKEGFSFRTILQKIKNSIK